MEFLKEVTNNQRYKKSECLGDIVLREKVNYYLSERSKILNKKNIDEKRFLSYEQKLIKDDWTAWWHHYTKNYLNNVLWLLKRMKINNTVQDEFNLLKQFYNKLPITTRRIGLYGMDNLEKDKQLADYFISNGVEIK